MLSSYPDKPPRLDPLRRFGVGLAIANALILSLLALALGLSLGSSRAAYGERARVVGENLALTLSLTVSAQLKQVDNALQSTLQQFNRQEEAGALAPATVQRIAEEQRALVPQVEAIRLTDANGLVINGEAGAAPVSVADRDYFVAARNRTAQLAVSEPLQGRFSKRWGVVLARARLDRQGRFLGIVYANLHTEHFRAVFDDVALGTQGAVTLRTESLRLVARYSPLDKVPNQGVGTATVSEQLRSQLAANPDKGAFSTRTALDGVERINTYQRVPGYPLLLVAGLGLEEYYRPWRLELLQQGALAALMAGLALALSVLLYRRQAAEIEARQQVARLAAEREVLLHSSLVGMVKVHDRIGRWYNPAFATMFGYDMHELVNHNARMFYPDEDSYQRVGQGYARLEAGDQYRTQVQLLRKDGRLIWVDLSGAPLGNGESLWMMLDITAVKDSEAQALRQALHDGLTGLANRAHLMDSLALLLRGAERNSQLLAVCYLDLDGFKAVNDVHGHEAGDMLLKEAAQRMRRCVRANDLVARLGGDEFAIVLTSLASQAELQVVLSRLVEALAHPFGLAGGARLSVGASVGVALHPQHGNQAEALLALADQAMYQAKRAGKSRFVVYAQEPAG